MDFPEPIGCRGAASVLPLEAAPKAGAEAPIVIYVPNCIQCWPGEAPCNKNPERGRRLNFVNLAIGDGVMASRKTSLSRRGMIKAAALAPMFLAMSPIGSAQQVETGAGEKQIAQLAAEHARGLEDGGMNFLLQEAERATFLLLGELHGDNETPALLHALWPALWDRGYRHFAAEISPWKVDQLVAGKAEGPSLWSVDDARFVNSFSKTNPPLWGCDMEEVLPNSLIRDLAGANPKNAALVKMAGMVEGGYNRAQAGELLAALQSATNLHDPAPGGVSLRDSLLATLEIDAFRAQRATRFQASQRREALMKRLFLQHLQAKGAETGKVMARFGRNHLHRGVDRRGISTLGNFISEYALATNVDCFNVGCFASSGEIRLAGTLMKWDERDDPAFAFLSSLNANASAADASATVFDMRPLRASLHALPSADLTPALSSLLYWADSYDALLHFRRVSPLPA